MGVLAAFAGAADGQAVHVATGLAAIGVDQQRFFLESTVSPAADSTAFGTTVRGWVAASLALPPGGVLEGGFALGKTRIGAEVVSITSPFDNPVSSKVIGASVSHTFWPWFFAKAGLGHGHEEQVSFRANAIQGSVWQFGLAVIKPSRRGLSGLAFLETINSLGSVSGTLGGRDDHITIVLLGVGLIWH
jgi:hypothetical protein